jgi:hypothetical protein
MENKQEYIDLLNRDDSINPDLLRGLPVEDCVINTYFIDATYPLYARLEYCFKNCGLSCIKRGEQ